MDERVELTDDELWKMTMEQITDRADAFYLLCRWLRLFGKKAEALNVRVGQVIVDINALQVEIERELEKGGTMEQGKATHCMECGAFMEIRRCGEDCEANERRYREKNLALLRQTQEARRDKALSDAIDERCRDAARAEGHTEDETADCDEGELGCYGCPMGAL